jgi:hypothetical protein
MAHVSKLIFGVAIAAHEHRILSIGSVCFPKRSVNFCSSQDFKRVRRRLHGAMTPEICGRTANGAWHMGRPLHEHTVTPMQQNVTCLASPQPWPLVRAQRATYAAGAARRALNV